MVAPNRFIGTNEIPRDPSGKMVSWERFGAFHLDMPVVVSYFTDLFYMRDAFELVRSCRLFELDYCIEQVPDRRSWEGNTSFKPQFLRRMAERFPSRAILWLDADARLRKWPGLLQGLRALIAYHTWFESPASGTVHLASHPKRVELIDSWDHECKSDTTAWDQVCMGRAVKNLGIQHEELPVEYCWIFDQVEGKDPTRVIPDPTSEPVIEHMQASRWTRLLLRQQVLPQEPTRRVSVPKGGV